MIKTITFFICFLIIGVMPIFGQIMADSISYKLELVNNEQVKALRTDRNGTFKDIKNQKNWKPFDSSYTASLEKSIWLQFELKNSSQDSVKIYLYSFNDYTVVYQKTDQDYKKIKNGFYVPFNERANQRERVFTELILKPFQKSQIYLRFDIHSEPTQTLPALYAASAYWEISTSNYKHQTNSIGFIYVYIIVLSTIFIFTIVFWLRLRKKLYLYYLGYLFFQIIYGFLAIRLTLAPFANIFAYAPNLAFNLFEPVQFIFIGFYIFFIRHLLQIEMYDRILVKALNFLGGFCFIYALSYFISNYFVTAYAVGKLFLIIRSVILPINLILIFWVINKVKHPLINYFIIGQSFFFIGAILSTYVGYSGVRYIPGHFFNFKESANIIFQMGLLAEVFCFSLALGKNIFLLQKEKEKANTQLIEQLQENQQLQQTMNLELDEKVQKKTSELIQLYSKIEQEHEQTIKNDFIKKIRETEMIALRSQMNPHFIFNSMSAIKNLIMTQRNDDAINYLDDFSSLLRSILQNSNRKKITVEEELEILELYLSLEKSRLGPSFSYTIQVSSKEALSQYEIPPLLLQPIAENAIWHGLQPSLKANKKLVIIFDTTKSLKIIIEDNGVGRKESAKKKKLHQSMGTNIIQDRLTLYNHLNNHNIRFNITDLEENQTTLGTRVTLTYDH